MLGFVFMGRAFGSSLARLVLWGCGLAVGLVALVGLQSLVSFDAFFTLFHQLGFANNLWQLDPERDYLVKLFPEGFWLDAMLFLAIASVVEAVVAGVVAWLLQRVDQKTAARPDPVEG